MKRLLRKLFTPLYAFIGVQIVWILIVVLWVYWFMGRHRELRELAHRYSLELSHPSTDWLTLTEGIVLLAIVLAGIYALFLFWRRQSKLYREQRDALSRVAHELKSPLASIRLHLETVRLRRPDPERLERFLDTMIADTERLDGLISNILLAARLEHGRRAAERPVVNLSAFLRAFLEKKRSRIPEGGTLEYHIEEGIFAEVEQEAMEAALRNLFENAILYSDDAPEITVALQGEGKSCTITFSDHGRGLEPRDTVRVFRIFHRVRRAGENIRGSGIGLYIVKSVVEEHGGRVTAESAGPGRGTTFRIVLPTTERRESGE